METKSVGFDIEGERVVIKVNLDRGEGAAEQAVAVAMRNPGETLVPPTLGLSKVETAAVEDQARTYYTSSKQEIDAAIEGLQRERKMADGILAAAVLCRRSMDTVRFGQPHSPEIVRLIEGGRVAMIAAVTQASGILYQYGPKGQALSHLHELADEALGGLVDFAQYAAQGEPGASSMHDSADRCSSQIDELLGAYEHAFGAP